MFGKIKIDSLKKNPAKSYEKDNNEDARKPERKKMIEKPANKKAQANNKKQRNGGRMQAGKIQTYRSQIQQQLAGSKFRLLNEFLYTNTSSKAFQYFREHAHDFEIYHKGFRSQSKKWSQNPLHEIIAYIQSHHFSSDCDNKKNLILDLGCGDAQLQQALAIKEGVQIRSFDLVAKKTFVQVADIAHLPVESREAAACVFSLSLMGKNYLDFIIEARRVLRQGGLLLIAEVQSRCKQWNDFKEMIQGIGFNCFYNKTNNFFRLMYFKANASKTRIFSKLIKQQSSKLLGCCLYKRR